MDRGKTSNLHTKPASADYCLDASDIEKFRPERSKNHILKDVQWGGDFEEATEYEGKNVSAISYGLFGGPYRVGGEPCGPYSLATSSRNLFDGQNGIRRK